MFFTRQDGATSAIVYAKCTMANCTTPGSWATVELPLPSGYLVPYESKVLAVDSAGVPSFVYLTNPNNVYFVKCTGTDCLQAASWHETQIQTGGSRFNLQYQGTTAYLGYLDFDSGTGGYTTCASNCLTIASWTRVEPFYAGHTTGLSHLGMAVGATGSVHLAFNQGVTATTVPAAVKANDNKLEYWSCSSGCLTASNWAGVLFDTDQGSYAIDLALTPAGGVAIASANATDSEVRSCKASCSNPATVWPTTHLDSPPALEALRAAKLSTPCGSSAFAASWLPSGRLTLTATATQLKVFSAARVDYECTTSSQYLAIGGVGRYFETPY